MARFRLTPPKLKQLEKHVVDTCLDLLWLRGYRPLRQHSGLLKTPDGRWIRVGEPGIPDYAVARFMVEFKRPGGELSPEQEAKIFELEKQGVLVAVVDSAEAFVAWLNDYEQKEAKKMNAPP